MPVPTLSEITHVPVDAERGSGTPATVYDHGNLVNQLNQSAQYKAENDWRKYNLFLGNLKDVYKDLNEVAKQPVMTEDQDKIKGELSSIFKDISKDPKSYFGGGPKFGEIQGRLAKLQSDATESKQNSLWDKAHREFFYRNPELDTEENRSLVEGYNKQPLGSRQPYLMKMPGLFDPSTMSTAINDLVKKDIANSSVTPDNQFIQTEKGTIYDPQKYRDIASVLYDQPDKRGVPLKKTIAERFEKLPDYIKQKYAGQVDPVKAYYMDLMEVYRKPDQMSKDELKPNPGYLEKEKAAEAERHHRAMEALERSGLSLNWSKFNYAKDEDKFGAATVLNEAIDIISKGSEVNVYNKTSKKNEKRLRVADPTLLKIFGTIDKDETTTNVPDFVEYNKDTDQLTLGYYDEKPENGKGGIVGREVKLDQRTWLKEIAKRSFPNKDIGKVNTLVDDILKDNGNSLFKMTQTSQANTSAVYEFNGEKYTADELRQAGWDDKTLSEAVQSKKIKKL